MCPLSSPLSDGVGEDSSWVSPPHLPHVCSLPFLECPSYDSIIQKAASEEGLLSLQKCKDKCFTVGISSPKREKWRVGQAPDEIPGDRVGSGLLRNALFFGSGLTHGFQVEDAARICTCPLGWQLLFKIQLGSRLSWNQARAIAIGDLCNSEDIFKCAVSSSLVNQLLGDKDRWQQWAWNALTLFTSFGLVSYKRVCTFKPLSWQKWRRAAGKRDLPKDRF